MEKFWLLDRRRFGSFFKQLKHFKIQYIQMTGNLEELKSETKLIDTIQ